MLDPFADKLTQGAVAICMAIQYPILFPILIIFILKEISMIVAACILLKKKKRPCPAKWYGKAATFMFYITFVTSVSYTHLDVYKRQVMDNGKILIQGTPQQVFSQVELLKQHGLDVTQATDLIDRLKKQGYFLPDGILNEAECVAALKLLLEENR